MCTVDVVDGVSYLAAEVQQRSLPPTVTPIQSPPYAPLCELPGNVRMSVNSLVMGCLAIRAQVLMFEEITLYRPQVCSVSSFVVVVLEMDGMGTGGRCGVLEVKGVVLEEGGGYVVLVEVEGM